MRRSGEGDLDRRAVVAAEREMAGWIAAHRGAPGVEVHQDPDATWMVHPGSAWGNCGANLRFTERSADRRLDRILRRYRRRGRGLGFWVSPFATPPRLGSMLARRGLRCRKHFPVMACDLRRALPREADLRGISFSMVEDHAVFLEHPHPYFGRISSPMRRFEMARLDFLVQQRPRRLFELVAWSDRIPVASATLVIASSVVGFHDVGTLRSHRRQGIGTALMRRGCAFARRKGCRIAVLLSSGVGHGMYLRAGFREAGWISYWYRSFGAA